MFSLTHQFIVKMYTYLQGYTFQLYRTVIRPLLKKQIHIKFYLYSWDPKCLQSEILSIQFFYFIIYFLFFFVALQPNACHGLLILEVSRSHTTTDHSR